VAHQELEKRKLRWVKLDGVAAAMDSVRDAVDLRPYEPRDPAGFLGA
jgi:hypothetical protein